MIIAFSILCMLLTFCVYPIINSKHWKKIAIVSCIFSATASILILWEVITYVMDH